MPLLLLIVLVVYALGQVTLNAASLESETVQGSRHQRRDFYLWYALSVQGLSIFGSNGLIFLLGGLRFCFVSFDFSNAALTLDAICRLSFRVLWTLLSNRMEFTSNLR